MRKSDDIDKIEHVPFAAGRVLRTVVYVKGSFRTEHHRHVLWNIQDEELDQTDVHAIFDALHLDINDARGAPERATRASARATRREEPARTRSPHPRAGAMEAAGDVGCAACVES